MTAAEPLRPTISIYQNPDHVAGILQQVHHAPLVIAESRVSGSDRTDNERTDRSASGGISVKGSVPVVGSVGGDAAGQRGRIAETGLTATSRTTQDFEYSQAYYLAVVRNYLRESGLLRAVKSVAEAEDLEVGDFVEYQATFQPNEINALLDILTPDLIAAITRHHFRTEGIKRFDAWNNFEEMRAFSEKNLAQSDANAELARAIAHAVRVDFRSEKTREFYGTIGSGGETVTAITICDNLHFVVDDEDRILDGRYTVLGKVTSPTTADVPVLERNKVLDRLNPEGVDDLFATLRTQATKRTQQFEAKSGAETPDLDDMFDTALASRIEGPSFKVVPIAIYA